MTDPRILVVGSGVIGLACALSLAKTGYSVAILGEVPAAFDPDADRGRVYALNEASCRLLRDIGTWDSIPMQHLFPFEAMHVRDAEHSLDFYASDVGLPELGVIVEDALLRSVLFEHLQSHPNAQLLCPVSFSSMKRDGRTYRVEFSDRVSIRPELVIGADGACSAVRRQLEIFLKYNVYGQNAVAATVALELPHQRSCWQWFYPDNILALLPLSANRGAVVWSCDRVLSEDLMRASQDEFAERLCEGLQGKFGAIELLSERAAFPLGGGIAERYAVEGAVLVGDAAHQIHPLAGQGANMGLADVRCLSNLVADGIVDRLKLRRYEREAKSRNAAMKLSLDVIKILFSSERRPVVSARRRGMRFINRCLPWKTWFIDRAAGRTW